ncbi:MAG: type II toxin-antitoxin system HicA family toxin [Gemmatimonadetes bacterium]|nr:type II toxin-antitoxin system HicA family toxin [Gemmatimonadota bacterium]MYG86746.1 type II toxin-antitoxin system HicA family toxin [Gemmatimonadota bacterium]MYJ88487.1 type II toxin-antitoxin system HicA family toxin [Gemmatimonadota bacterium]
MKRRAFIKKLTDDGCFLKRHGRRHDLYFNPKNNKWAPVPRHREISESLCKLIRQQLQLNDS